ncbi:hypothetical protein GCM10023322_64340 [Rugosimonospora acidiphila]|uniref:Carboxymuconolactone decarboxylase-like domain-containing protein n=1 Tax=Rugosimonospora acidiphila TaxID=556531 RepID=A0ABP9SK78_9ACTN
MRANPRRVRATGTLSAPELGGQRPVGARRPDSTPAGGPAARSHSESAAIPTSGHGASLPDPHRDPDSDPNSGELTGRPAPARPRCELQHPAELESAARALYDAITKGPRGAQAGTVPLTDGSGRLLGPFDVMLRSPQVGDAVQRLGAAIRFGGLPERGRELAILTVAATLGSEFEWWSHEPAARSAGLDTPALRRLLDGRVPDGLNERERAMVRIAGLLARDRRLDDEDYAEAVRVLGHEQLAVLTWLVGYYGMLALALEVFRPPNPLLPEPR